jgi:uncharacterized membrane protein
MTSTQRRLAYIDWMRGLACVLMFQTHCYDSWLSPEARGSALFAYSRLGGTLPAPLFIFLAGLSVALVTEKLRESGVTRDAIARQVILRGAEVFALGILFRAQEYVLGVPWVPWTDLLRVDVLNILGISMMLLGAMCWLAGEGTVEVLRRRSITLAVASGAVVAMTSPALWTSWRLKFLPWPVESYINGVHIFDKPQPWLFPVFPWTAFAFGGLVIGILLFGDFAKARPGAAFAWIGLSGAGLFLLALIFDRGPLGLPGDYDFWHTSPNFFLARCGILLVILFFAYAWCAWGWGQAGFSPLAQLGKTSLLVYWVHIEFVYGRFSILPKGKCSIGLASGGLAAIFAGMLALSVARTRWKSRLRA